MMNLGMSLSSYPSPGLGRDGEPLSGAIIDSGRLGFFRCYNDLPLWRSQKKQRDPSSDA
jgi:hypothetical protein